MFIKSNLRIFVVAIGGKIVDKTHALPDPQTDGNLVYIFCMYLQGLDMSGEMYSNVYTWGASMSRGQPSNLAPVLFKFPVVHELKSATVYQVACGTDHVVSHRLTCILVIKFCIQAILTDAGSVLTCGYVR